MTRLVQTLQTMQSVCALPIPLPLTTFYIQKVVTGDNTVTLKVLGISGSPIPNSNTDRAVIAVLKGSGLESEFVKLSEINVRPSANLMTIFQNLLKRCLKRRH
jgi:hypothetical protein